MGENLRSTWPSTITWNLTLENKTLFKSKHAIGTWCYNPDIFGIKAITDEEGYIYLTWYVNNGCNNFFGYFMILKDTQIVVPPIELSSAE